MGGKCKCKEGYTGLKCDSCVDTYYKKDDYCLLRNIQKEQQLYAAAKAGNLEEVKQLLNTTFVDSDDNPYDYTPLIIAAQDGHKDIVALLLDNNANINQQDKWGWTALMLAASNGKKEV